VIEVANYASFSHANTSCVDAAGNDGLESLLGAKNGTRSPDDQRRQEAASGAPRIDDPKTGLHVLLYSWEFMGIS
jgi:hypothetical protein